MKIAFNPSTVAALTTPPDNKDITFDLRGHNIFARGVKFYGTDTNTWRDIKINNVSIGSNVLDLRNGNNTTLTNTDGVVTINSTWRPVVDNLTSDSTTSSLSANQGRILAGLINGKSDSDHNHDGRYLRLSGQDTMQGNLYLHSYGTSYIGKGLGDKSGADFTEANIVIRSWWGISFKSFDDVVRTYIDTRTGNIGTKGVLNAVGAVIQGRVYNNGDDEGIIIKPYSNGCAGLILGTHNGERSVFYLLKGEPLWRYNNGSTSFDIYHPKKPGIIALTSDIPSKDSWNYDDRYLKLTGGWMSGDINFGGDNKIYWGRNTDAAFITLVKSGVAGGTTLVLSQQNDTNDTIQFQTNPAARLYHNSYPILTTQNTYVNNNKGYINGTEITQVNNSDTVDGWHKDQINRTLFITSSTPGLSSYWAKLWEINLNNQYNDVTVTFLAAASYYPSYFSIFSVYLRQNGSGTSKNISARLVELIGNIAIGDTELRLYVNDTTGNCQLWGNVKGQCGTMNLSVLKKAWRTEVDSPNMGTFFSTDFSSVQPLPGDGWNKIGVTWNPSNFNVPTAQYLRSLGNQNCQTGRTQNYGDVYTYNTIDSNTGSPTSYSSVIGFGRGIEGTVEIAGGWCNTNLYWRSLRDCCEDWYSWRTVLDSYNYTGFIDNYYWANVKISTSSSTTTSPTVQNLTATNSIKMGNISLEHTDEINNIANAGIHLNYRNSGNVSLCQGGGRVGIGTMSPTQKLDVAGNIRATGQIVREGSAQVWVNGRNGALLRETSVSGYHTLWSLKTTDGSWDFGEYNINSDWNNIPVLSYVTDSNYNSGNNATTYQIKFPLASGTVALTSQLPSQGGDESHPIFLGYLNLNHGDDGTVSSSFSCLGYSVPFTYTRGGNYCRIIIPNTTRLSFYVKAATASVNYSGGGMDTWVGTHRNTGAWWLHCYAYGWQEVRVKGFRLANGHNDSWWGGNPLYSYYDGANRITVCIFGYVKFK